MPLTPQLGDTPHGNSTRPPANGARGMVASASQHATIAGLLTLQHGGNAVDAAVATAVTLGVAEPFMSGMGGVGTGLVHVADTPGNPMTQGDGSSKHAGKTRVINFSGQYPAGADVDSLTRADLDGVHSQTVPGNLTGWLAMHDAHGTKSLTDLFAYAIELAVNGVPMTPLMASTIADAAQRIADFSVDGDRAPLIYDEAEVGALLQQPLLAESMATIAENGADEFTDGALAARMADGVRRLGGSLSRDDLATYRPRWEETISTTYRGYEVRAPGPNSSAFQILQTLNILRGMDLQFGDVRTLHLVIEAVLLAADERVRFGGDPRFVDIPLDDILSDRRADELRSQIDPDRAAGFPPERFGRSNIEVVPGVWQLSSSGLAPMAPMTTHFATADCWGNVVTVTQTLGGGFGSGVAPGNTGIFINNIGKWFDLREGSPNDLAPGKAVDFVIAPTQLFRDQQFVASIGTPGSYGILHTTLQMIHAFVDGASTRGLNIQEVVEYPRFRYYDKGALFIEARIGDAAVQALRDMGHRIELMPPFTNAVGGAHAIHRTAHGTYLGAADPRRDGFALGW